jgi:flagellar biogenesis protein FliO
MKKVARMSIALILLVMFILVVAYLYMYDTIDPTTVGQLVLALVVIMLLMYWVSSSPQKMIYGTSDHHNHKIASIAECIAESI